MTAVVQQDTFILDQIPMMSYIWCFQISVANRERNICVVEMIYWLMKDEACTSVGCGKNS